MSAAALVGELTAAGIRLSHDGSDLVADVLPGVDLDSFREQIATHKPALVAELRLREEIVAAATATQASFDRQHYDRLWAAWHALAEHEAADTHSKGGSLCRPD